MRKAPVLGLGGDGLNRFQRLLRHDFKTGLVGVLINRSDANDEQSTVLCFNVQLFAHFQWFFSVGRLQQRINAVELLIVAAA